MVASQDETISFSFNTSLHIGEKAKKDIWVKLIGLSKSLIETHIVSKMVDLIFDRGETVKIGSVTFSKEGYSHVKTKLFGKGETETVYWSDHLYTPKFQSGMVILWQDKNGTSHQFSTVSMSTPNAVVIPELLQACVNRV